MLVLNFHHSLYYLVKIFKIIGSEVNFMLKVKLWNDNWSWFLKINLNRFWSVFNLLSGLLMVVFIDGDKARVILFVQVKDLSKYFTLSLFQLNRSEMSNGVAKSLETNPSALLKYDVSYIVNFIYVSLEIINKDILLALLTYYWSLSRIMTVNQMSAVFSNVSKLQPRAQIALD